MFEKNAKTNKETNKQTKNGFKRTCIHFCVHFNPIDTNDLLDTHKYFIFGLVKKIFIALLTGLVIGPNHTKSSYKMGIDEQSKMQNATYSY